MMAEDKEILVNRFMRSLKLNDVLQAMVMPGLHNINNYSGLGDCLILDFSNSFFGLADSSNRNSSFSKNYLIKFSHMLEGVQGYDPEHEYNIEEINALIPELVERNEKILREISGKGSCTFTGVLFVKTALNIFGIVFNTGDSSIYRCSADLETIVKISENNFWLVGKSNRIYQTEVIEIEPGSIFVLATDGCDNLITMGNNDIAAYFRSVLSGNKHENLIRNLYEKYYCDVPIDDSGMIILKPESIPSYNRKIFLGGTTIGEERLFQNQCKEGVYPDKSIPLLSGSDKTVIIQ